MRRDCSGQNVVTCEERNRVDVVVSYWLRPPLITVDSLQLTYNVRSAKYLLRTFKMKLTSGSAIDVKSVYTNYDGRGRKGDEKSRKWDGLDSWGCVRWGPSSPPQKGL